MRATVLFVCLLWSVTQAHEVTVIPIRLQGEGHLAIVRIDDISLNAIIDTSGYHAVGISPSALQRLRVRYSSGAVERIDGEGHRFRGREFQIDRLRLGDTVFENVRGFERLEHDSGAFGGSPFEVSIGRDFLQHFTVVIDYPNNQIELHRYRAVPGVCRGSVADLRQSAGGIHYSVVTTADGPMRLAWDTGAAYSIIQQDLVRARGLDSADGRFTTRLAIGARSLGAHRMIVMSLPGVPDIDGLLGANFFARHRVCVDYGRRQVHVR